MRDLALVLSFVFFLPLAMVHPFAGVLVWEWLTVMNPHREVYGFALGQPFNLAVAVVTLGAWLLSREPKRFPPDAIPWLLLALALWMTFNSFFAPDPEWSWPLWERTMKTLVFVLLLIATVTTKARIHAMVWVLVLSIGYYGVKGGLFTVATGGSYLVMGPADTVLGDNNSLAVAIASTLPFVNYLRLYSAKKWLRWALGAAMVTEVIAVLGTHSRGGLIALVAGVFVFWLRSYHKLLYGLASLAVLVPVLLMMPDQFWDRMSTIGQATQDESFLGRITAWQVATYYAIDHFPFGAGFAGPERAPIYHDYFPDTNTHAAHSIYFQVLGEHGFPALALYLTIILLAFRNTFRTLRLIGGRAGLRWANELARMCQVSIVIFCVGGAALSMAYYDSFLITVALTCALPMLVRQQDPDRQSDQSLPVSSSVATKASLGRHGIRPAGKPDI
jgi:putative inorganic carbon (HCO3(-)) transporter